jgi:hypothetical protein
MVVAAVLTTGCSGVPDDQGELARAESEVRAAHAAYVETLLGEGADAALERFYDDDYTYVGVDGIFIDKAGLKARMKRNELAHIELVDDLRRVSVYGDVAVISGHSTTSAMDKGEKWSGTEGFTAVWVKRDGRWLVVAEQATQQNR